MLSSKCVGQIEGKDIHLVTLCDGHGSQVELLSFGALIYSLSVPDKNGKLLDVCLGYENIESYRQNDPYLGVCVGRCAGRIKNAQFSLHDKVWTLSKSDPPNHIHGGFLGFSRRVWDVDVKDEAVTFFINSPHGEEGYPGTVNASVSYRFSAPGCLEISYEAKTDTATPISLTNHSYFNLCGHDSGKINEQYVSVCADSYTKSDAENITTGEISAVEGTPLDLREAKKIGPLLAHEDLQITKGIDHNFVIAKKENKPIASLYSEKSGICLEVYTSMPSLQVYTAGFLNTTDGKDGACYGMHDGICFETQHYPNAVNHSHFPSPILQPEDVYMHKTSFCFSVKD